jgi:hypothetical protein
MTDHDPICPLYSNKTVQDHTASCDYCGLIDRARKSERRNAATKAEEPIYYATDGLSAKRILWAIDPDLQPHEIGWRHYLERTVELCQRCGEIWPCLGSKTNN